VAGREIVGALILAEPIGARLDRGAAEPFDPSWRHLSAGVIVFALAALVLRFTLPLSPDRSSMAIAAALDTVPPPLRTQPVLNEYDLGGQLIFAGVRPFIDSRADLYGDAFLTRYHRIATGDRAEWDRTLSAQHIAWTIFPAGHPIVAVPDERPGWRRLVEADGIVIHVRADQPPR
jgi:hypothetical protein